MIFAEEIGFNLKKLDATEQEPTHDIKSDDGSCHITVKLLTNKEEYEMFHVDVHAISETTIAGYERLHRPFCNKRSSEQKDFIMCYDLRESELPFDVEILKSLATLKQSLISEYKTSLICTIVIVESEAVKMILNTLLTTMYTPVRPVRLVKTSDDANEFLRGEMKKQT